MSKVIYMTEENTYWNDLRVFTLFEPEETFWDGWNISFPEPEPGDSTLGTKFPILLV